MADLTTGAVYGDAARPARGLRGGRRLVRALIAREGLDAALVDARDAVAAAPASACGGRSRSPCWGRSSCWSTTGRRGGDPRGGGERGAGPRGRSGAGVRGRLAALSAIEREDWATADALSRRTAAAARTQYDPDSIAAACRCGRGWPRTAGLAERAARWPRSGRPPGAERRDVLDQRPMPARGRPDAPRAGRSRGRRSASSKRGHPHRRPQLGAWPTRSPRSGPIRACRRPRRDVHADPGGGARAALLPTYLTAAEMAEPVRDAEHGADADQALYGSSARRRGRAVEAAIEIGLLEPLPVLAPGRITSTEDAPVAPTRECRDGRACAPVTVRCAMADREEILRRLTLGDVTSSIARRRPAEGRERPPSTTSARPVKLGALIADGSDVTWHHTVAAALDAGLTADRWSTRSWCSRRSSAARGRRGRPKLALATGSTSRRRSSCPDPVHPGGRPGRVGYVPWQTLPPRRTLQPRQTLQPPRHPPR